MRPELHLSIASPCSESWEQMTPATQGRFCASCSKTVINFSTMTDSELLDWFAKHPGPVCGRFLPGQLERPLMEQPKKKPGLARYWHYLVALLLSSTELAAQTKPAKPVKPLATQQIPFGREGQYLTGDTLIFEKPESPPEVLQGTVVDEKGRPLSFATILYKEHKGVVADSIGRFSIPRADLGGSQFLTITAVGCEKLLVDISQIQTGQIALLPMKSLPVFVGGAVASAVVKHRKRKPVADTLALIKDTLVSCLPVTKKTLTLYPNPVPRGNSITLTAKLEPEGTYTIQLYNISGLLLQSTTASSSELSGAYKLSLPAILSPGVYIVQVSHPGISKPCTQQFTVL
jgi:hypothetical protein